jgi:hypothetical protein
MQWSWEAGGEALNRFSLKCIYTTGSIQFDIKSSYLLEDTLLLHHKVEHINAVLF